MTINLRITLISLLVIGIFAVYKVIKKNRISLKYAMSFTIVFIFLLLLIIFPNMLNGLKEFLGFKEVSNMLFLIAIFILFFIVFVTYITITKLGNTNRRLVQEISILKNELNKK